MTISDPTIAFVILARNEETNLPACLESLRSLPHEIFVIDSGSTDRTVQIARQYCATVLNHPFVNYASQFNWALDNIKARAPWIFRLDADEFLTPELAEELREKLPTLAPAVTGVLLKRRFYFLGRWIRFGGMYPIWHLRLFRTGVGRVEQRWADEHIILSEGSIVQFQGDFVDNNRSSLEAWTKKHNEYSSREVFDHSAPQETHRQLTAQASRRRWAKEAVYAKFPRFARPFLYWFVRYFVLLGFLDGREGLIFHFLQGFWYRFLVDSKLEERDLKARNDVIPK